MSVPEIAAATLIALGVGVTVLAAVTTLHAPDVFARLHLTGPVTSVGAPLVALGLIVDQGMTLASAQIALIAALLVLSGPAVTMAVARVEAQRRHGSAEDEPE